jgi:hypothetical protein
MLTMTPVAQRMKTSSTARPLFVFVLALFAMNLLSGCDQRYVVDKKKQQVFLRLSGSLGDPEKRMLITNADAATFEVFKLPGPTGFARDKSRVYLYGLTVDGAHSESFRKLDIHGGIKVPGGGNYYYRDSEHVFVWPFSLGGFIHMLPDSDPEFFRVLTNGWSRDRTRVYLFEEGFVPRDIESFEPLDRDFSRDNKASYKGTNEISGPGQR